MKKYLILCFVIVQINAFGFDLNISNQSKSKIVCNGDSANLWVDVDGSNLKFIWTYNNQVIENEHYRILTIKNFDYTKSGIYNCFVSDSISKKIVKSEDIVLYNATETIFIKQAKNVLFNINTNAIFETKIHTNLNAENNVKLQWYFLPESDLWDISKLVKIEDDNKFSGTTTEILSINTMKYADKGAYYCIAQGECGNDTAIAILSDNLYFKLTNISKDYEDCEGHDVTFEVKIENNSGTTLDLQWFNPVLKEINESDKYIGTKTNKLTIKNVNSKDNKAYYLKVTSKELNMFKRSDHFYLQAQTKPEILVQPADYTILDRELHPTYHGQTYVGVTVKNSGICKFNWYRNDTLVRSTNNYYSSNYFLGSNGVIIPAKMSDVGEYQCEIINECGTTWSKKATVVWGYKDIFSCEGSDVELISDSISKNTNKYSYVWYFKDKEIKESNKYKNVTTNKLTINKLTSKDQGSYYVYYKTLLSGVSKFLGKVYLQVNIVPKITRQLPDTMYLDGKFIKKDAIVVNVVGDIFSYQIFNKDNEPMGNSISKKITNIYDEYQIIYLGGPDLTLADGTYYFKFWNTCGIVKSNYFTINSIQKPVRIIIDSLLISSIKDKESSHNFSLYPNPSQYILNIKTDQAEFHKSELKVFNALGQDLSNYIIASTMKENEIQIDISALKEGIYYIRYLNYTGKFVRIN
ncbi:MAG TPA: T9SS type A sorting domain-containing protein [Candidatus Kapabacteria bacterium]|nr:T9SS type A sorting domain-containing protein [Candidatus Kapabacteria bacterium]